MGIRPQPTRQSPKQRETSDRHARFAAETLRRARDTSGLSLRALAVRAGTSHPTLVAYEQGRKVPTVTTYLRILEACDCAVDVELSPRVRSRNGLDRGEELRQVLDLAEQFPARLGRKPGYPRFPTAPSA